MILINRLINYKTADITKGWTIDQDAAADAISHVHAEIEAEKL